jgi:hypothetical protein
MKNRIKEFKTKPLNKNIIINEERKKAPQPIIVKAEVIKEKEIIIKQKPVVNIEEINRIKDGLTVKSSKAPSIILNESINDIKNNQTLENKIVYEQEPIPIIEQKERLTKSSRGRPTIIKEQKSSKVILRFVENSFEQY